MSLVDSEGALKIMCATPRSMPARLMIIPALDSAGLTSSVHAAQRRLRRRRRRRAHATTAHRPATSVRTCPFCGEQRRVRRRRRIVRRRRVYV